MTDTAYGETIEVSPARSLPLAMWRGACSRCPNCGEGKLFASFVKTVPACEHCGEVIEHHRADDLPAYLTMFVVGHVVVGLFMGFEATTNLSAWQHLAIWVPITIVMSLALLRPIKGATVGLQWALRMHGFGEHKDEIETHPEASGNTRNAV
ncbi:DUF983 domain-containing protein [Mesorhizobium sp. RP14(2022)]|uniref:DUF983 domain-containing protein n=1 Tax=Mesorhizobium liriopis TaxID=2953882 RepID=A0ABT1CAX9_9HYPH|nr:DUF983 domain-containing protein [Mesorhizobium liriopis]MCO6051979.1 DUF983 domain-containing protein [Mesorhizobium liriopis]